MSTSRTRLYEAKTRVDLAPDGVSLTFASSEQDIIEFLDDAGKVIPGQAFIQPPRDITSPELLALIGDQMPAVLAERDALQAQVAQMTADHAAALEAKDQEKTQALADAATAAAEDKVQALADAAAAAQEAQTAAVAEVQARLDAANAQIAALTAPPDVRKVAGYRFKAALRKFPSPTGDPARTLRQDVDDDYPNWDGEDQDAWNANEFYLNDPRLNARAAKFTGGDATAAQALLVQIFDVADTIP